MMVGSLRKESFNRSVANVIVRELQRRDWQTEFAVLDDLPLMNQDIEFPTPTNVMRLREQVKTADALWIVSPEYNEMIPGVLKNALDWLSRPTKAGVFGAPDFIQDFPVVLSGAGGRKGAKVGLAHLMTLTKFMGMRPLPDSVGLRVPMAAFQTNRFDLDGDQKAAIIAQIAQLQSAVK
ncbi:NAD(P)H-dependent oxidoreductase [Levilactobacillus namurensis]|nr:NADPH-dependent FMN reductase [Levilactobacillus namurensis]MCW3778127.1 NAD(P)H-dependent oxidoreductase [Levilactobacillus namurensis]MDT7018116.1 NADPH-dependent FMN reductase [Levilactobacillus namurensis]